jgi:hypothetical protein
MNSRQRAPNNCPDDSTNAARLPLCGGAELLTKQRVVVTIQRKCMHIHNSKAMFFQKGGKTFRCKVVKMARRIQSNPVFAIVLCIEAVQIRHSYHQGSTWFQERVEFL